MKILYTIPNFDTAGSGKALLALATRLDRAQFEPHICCDHDHGAFFAVVRASGIPIHLAASTSKVEHHPRMFWHCWRNRQLFKGFDLVHSFHYGNDYTEPLAARLAGCKWVFTKKNMSWGGAGKRAWWLRSRLANGIIAQNTDMIRFFFPGSKKVRLIPRGVDTRIFFPRPPDNTLYNEFHLPPEAKIILTVANLVPIKGIEHLITAFSRLAGASPNTVLCIVGDDRNDYGQQLKIQARALLPEQRICFTGKQHDISAFLSIATCLVLPTLSRGEGSPVAVLEAMAAGVPVVASAVAGIRDQLAGFPDQLFRPGDATALAEALRRQLTLPAAARAAIIERQLAVIHERYTIEREVQEHEAFYHQVLAR